MLSATARLNEALEQPFQDFLTAVLADDRNHVRFLNMLSLLEHLGSRKIMLSQMKGILTQDILKHLAEETRHAFFFKREAEKLCGIAAHPLVRKVMERFPGAKIVELRGPEAPPAVERGDDDSDFAPADSELDSPDEDF